MPQPLLSTGANKSKKGGKRKHLDAIKYDSAGRQLYSESYPSLDPSYGSGPVPGKDAGKDAGGAKPTASSKCIGSILVLSTTIWPLCRCQS